MWFASAPIGRPRFSEHSYWLQEETRVIVYAACHICGMSSSCSNPLLYGFLNENFSKVSSRRTKFSLKNKQFKGFCSGFCDTKTTTKIFRTRQGKWPTTSPPQGWLILKKAPPPPIISIWLCLCQLIVAGNMAGGMGMVRFKWNCVCARVHAEGTDKTGSAGTSQTIKR